MKAMIKLLFIVSSGTSSLAGCEQRSKGAEVLSDRAVEARYFNEIRPDSPFPFSAPSKSCEEEAGRARLLLARLSELHDGKPTARWLIADLKHRASKPTIITGVSNETYWIDVRGKGEGIDGSTDYGFEVTLTRGSDRCEVNSIGHRQ